LTFEPKKPKPTLKVVTRAFTRHMLGQTAFGLKKVA
jgi:hypothetical protein